MKTISTSVSEKIFNFVFVSLTSAGLGYALVNQFILDKPNKDLLLLTICLFLHHWPLGREKSIVNHSLNSIINQSF